MPDRVERLRKAAQARHEATLRRAENTLRRLIRRGAPVTARQLAAEASVSRSWLYRQPELRQQLDRLRALPTPSGRPLPAEQRASTESLQQQIHTEPSPVSCRLVVGGTGVVRRVRLAALGCSVRWRRGALQR